MTTFYNVSSTNVHNHVVNIISIHTLILNVLINVSFNKFRTNQIQEMFVVYYLLVKTS